MISIALSAAACGLCVGLLAAGLIRFPKSRISGPLLASVVTATLWALGSTLTELTSDPAWDQVWIAVAYTGGILLPPMWWILGLKWAELSAVPVAASTGPLARTPLVWASLIWIAMLANPWHHTFLIPVDGARSIYGPLWWAMAIPNYVLGLGALWVGLSVNRRARSPGVRFQARLIVTASSLVPAGHMTYVLWPTTPAFDLPVLAIAVSTALIVVAMRSEEERRQYTERLRTEVRARTAQLEEANQTLRRLQTQLLRAERLRAGEELAGSVVHAIRNPLTALLGAVGMARERSEGRDPTWNRVLRLGQRIEEVIDSTLALFRTGRLKLEAHSPIELIDEAMALVRPAAESRFVRLEANVKENLPTIVVDRALWIEALATIASNGIEAMDGGGALLFEAELLPGLDVVRFRISDSGPGIPAELREQVFEPFFTTKGGGTGLGMAIARGVVHGHQGRIRIEDRSGGGASVVVEIPSRQSTLASGTLRGAAREAELAKKSESES